ncbi:TPA: hypothetical protein ACXISS_001291 [Salmonella enterica subsp. enterica serovar Kottbus]|nr:MULTISPECIES: hypothetical protein [Enterobacteriaceae]WEA79074.1 hypothetical protein PXN04_21420 [Citrobacter braakii]
MEQIVSLERETNPEAYDRKKQSYVQATERNKVIMDNLLQGVTTE